MDFKTELQDKGFKFKHSLGQNFISDTNLLKAITMDADIQSDDCVLEIGAGAGTLTKEILNKTKNKVVAVEIDKNLMPVLQNGLKEFLNLTLVFDDILKVDPQKIKELFGDKSFKVIANLPYYISTPIIFYLLENDFNLTSITVMLQKEVAERLSAKPKTKDYGAITILLDILGDVSLKRKVPKTLFTPVPKVDSAIVNIKINKQKYDVNFSQISKFVKSSFAMRRKTLSNNLLKAFEIPREKFEDACKKIGININCRAEDLTTEQFVLLYKTLF